ncbi:MAG: hypothetical protein IJW28_05755, partial [Clostridia bacterium]|nr:hypothetical protein [Clostridia bacterium]
MNDKKMVLKHSSKKIVNRVFALVFAVAVFGTIFFAIMTFITNVNLNKTDFSSYLSFSDEIDINKVYGSSTQYKVSHTINVTNYTREKLTIDLVLTYKNEDNTIFVKTKTVVLNPSVKQNVYMYYYHDTNSVELKSINFRL